MSDVLSESRKHISDMIAVDSHILEAIERQRQDERVLEHVDTNRMLIEIERTLRDHVQALEALADTFGAKGESVVKKAVTEALGFVAGLYDKIRDHKLSRMLRDDYTALSLAAMSYTALHSFGLAVREQKIADLALRHLNAYTGILVEISRLLPFVVVEEVAEEVEGTVDTAVGHIAMSNTQRAWKSGAAEGVI